MDFQSGVHEILSDLEDDNDWKMKMDRPSTSFTPCLVYMIKDQAQAESESCRHEASCTVHDDTYKCQNYSSPTGARTKIGVELNTAFTKPDGSKTYISCDLSCPVLSTTTDYDGGIQEVQEYLSTAKPVGWLTEYRKLVDMRAARNHPGVRSGVRMRHINRDTVLPRQVRLTTW